MSSQKIILLEDDPIISWDLSSILKSLDCKVSAQFESSCEYTHSELCTSSDIIITNLRLYDGWLSDSMLRQMSDSSMGLLILTGLGDPAYYDLREIPHVALTKPYTRHQLKRSISLLRKAS